MHQIPLLHRVTLMALRRVHICCIWARDMRRPRSDCTMQANLDLPCSHAAHYKRAEITQKCSEIVLFMLFVHIIILVRIHVGKSSTHPPAAPEPASPPNVWLIYLYKRGIFLIEEKISCEMRRDDIFFLNIGKHTRISVPVLHICEICKKALNPRG